MTGRHSGNPPRTYNDAVTVIKDRAERIYSRVPDGFKQKHRGDFMAIVVNADEYFTAAEAKQGDQDREIGQPSWRHPPHPDRPRRRIQPPLNANPTHREHHRAHERVQRKNPDKLTNERGESRADARPTTGAHPPGQHRCRQRQPRHPAPETRRLPKSPT